MNLQNLTDKALLEKTLMLVKEEREILTQLLHHLLEVDRRRLFSGLKLKSLKEYVVKVLGYTSDEADRRIQAMKLMKAVPEVEAKINNGLTLTHLSMAQSLFNSEKKYYEELTKEEKLQVLEKLESTTTREAQRVVIEESSNPEKLRKESVKPVSQTLNEMKIYVDDETLENIETLKGLFAHSDPNMTHGELFKKLTQMALAEMTVAQRKSRPDKESKAEIRRQIWARDNCKCTNCGSQFAVQEDHIVPQALGGEYSLENMRLLCRSCNQWAAIQIFGQQKMDLHLNF